MKKDLKNFIVLTEIDSTNNYANHLISADSATNGTVVLAQYQKKGRGQRGNYWESAPGKNLLASVVLFPSFLPVPKQFYLSKITSLALVNWLSGKIDSVRIKWPNDIYAGNNKIAGILIETSVKGNSLHSAVVGIGLNLNQLKFSSEIPNPVSLKMITGQHSDIIDAANEFREILLELYEKLKEGKYNEIDNAYFNFLYRKNEWAAFKEKGQLIEARILGIGEYGQLLLEDRSGNIKAYMFKEVEFIV